MISRNKIESAKGIRLSGYSCVVCGWNSMSFKKDSLVVGAHVRSFESGSEFDKSDNIIALCPNHHAEYDGYAFTIDSKTRELIFLDESNPFHGKNIANRIKHIKTAYIAYEQYLFNKMNGL